MRIAALGIIGMAAAFFLIARSHTLPATSLAPIQTYPSPTPAPDTSELTKIQIRNELYRYAIISVEDPSRIRLIPNYSQKHTSTHIAETNTCTSGINGGFYTPESIPLGLVISDFKMIAPEITNATVNGFFSILGVDARISFDSPASTANIALQTGPMLISDSQSLSLRIRNDESARRSVAAITPTGAVIFITISRDNQLFSGPLLTDLPQIISAISKQENIHISDAINLDGGSASAFFSPKTSIQELITVGSLLCVTR